MTRTSQPDLRTSVFCAWVKLWPTAFCSVWDKNVIRTQPENKNVQPDPSKPTFFGTRSYCMHESPRTPCRYQLYAYAYTHAPHQQHSHLLHVDIKYACITSTAFTFAHLLLLSTTANQPSLHSPFLLVLSFSHNHPLPSLLAVCSFFPRLCILFTWRSLQKHNNRAQGCVAFQAWKGAEALLSCLSDKHKKRAQLGTASQQMAFPGRELASVPGRDWQTCPGRALANVPRQGTGKASQAGTAQCAQAGHWQTFPGRELASVPRQGTGKRPRQGLQACPGRACTLASVPRQGTGKRPRHGLQTCPGRALANVPRQGTVDVPRQGTVVVPM